MTEGLIVQLAREEGFLRYLHGRMDDDIKAATSQNATFLSILGLSAYTEILGGLIRGKFGRGECKKNYEAALRKMGAKYEKLLEDGYDLYDIIRCGLVHEYFIKMSGSVGPRSDSPRDPGIGVDPKGMKTNGGYVEILRIGIENYHRDFNRAFEKLIAECQAP